MSHELHSLISAACDGRATDEELAELTRRLRDDLEARDEYLRYVDLHSALSDEVLPAHASAVVAYQLGSDRGQNANLSAASKGRFGWYIAIAASVVIVAVIVGFRTVSSPSQIVGRAGDGERAATVPIATLLYSEDCKWQGNALSEGQPLHPGGIHLVSGTAMARFDGGAELVLVGPAAIELLTPASVRLQHGDVVVRASNGAEGFVVATPISEVIDLGTEFAVRVQRTGATEVHVLDGEVSYRGIHAAEQLSKILRAGEGVIIDETGRPRAIPMNSPRFHEFVSSINPQPRSDLLQAYEGFHYSPGNLPLNESTMGRGWNGPWRLRHPRGVWGDLEHASQENLTIVHGEIDVAWPVPGGRLGALKLPPEKLEYERHFRHPIDLDSNSVTFFSLMVQTVAATTDRSSPDRMQLSFAGSPGRQETSVTFGIVGARLPFIRLPSGAKVDSAVRLPTTDIMLWIGKIVTRKNGNDEFCFRAYSAHEQLNFTEPATWQVEGRAASLPALLDRVVLRCDSSRGIIIDELRIGPTWRSVAPISEQSLE